MQNKPTFKFYLNNKCLEVRQEGEETKDFTLIPLHMISVQHLKNMRNSNVSGFVLKQNRQYWFADISAYKHHRVCLETVEPHQCAICGRLSAASDKDGGCAKVRDFSKCIENFAWITHGYETFNTSADVFMVFKCQHWKKSTYHPTHIITQQDKVFLAQFLWDNIDDYNDVRIMMEREQA